MLEELTPEKISMLPVSVTDYVGGELEPGESVRIRAAHLSASGSSLQLCALLWRLVGQFSMEEAGLPSWWRAMVAWPAMPAALTQRGSTRGTASRDRRPQL